MKKVSLLIFVSLILLLAFTACGSKTETPAPEHEHEWTEATCTAAKTCECGAVEGSPLGHDWTEATCTAPKTCKTCNEIDGDALDHNWLDPTCEDPMTCKDCGKTSGYPNGHDMEDATCTTPATCKVCKATEGEAAGHKWSDATCHTPKTCKSCGATEGDVLDHDWADPTCTAPQTCKLCGDTQGEALGHTLETVPGTPASCTATGLTDGKKCSVCGTVTVKQEVISMLAHTEEVVPGTPASCTATGLTDGKKCSVCGTTTVVQTTISALGHTAGPEATCTEDQTCTLCGEVLESAFGHMNLGPQKENETPASCLAPGGYDMVDRCLICGVAVTTEHTTYPQLDHKFEDYKHDEGSEKCGVDGTKTSKCSYLCGTTDTVTDVGTALEHKAPDVLVCGEHWACVHGCGYTSPEAVAHDWTKATCITLSTCKRCGETTGDYAAHTPGAPVAEDIVDSGCVTTGTYNAVVYCSVDGCGYKMSTTPTEIPAKGHSYGPATCNSPAACTVCGATTGEVRSNHDVKMSYNGGVLKYYCASGCDIEFVADQKYVADGSDKNFYFASNGSCTLDNNNGEYTINWSGEDKSATYTYGPGGQPMLWIPSNAASNSNYLTNLNCESNAFGVISFKMQTSMSDSFVVGIGKPRGKFSDWNTSILEIIRIGKVEVGADHITIDGGFLDETSKQFHIDIPVEGGWSEWFEVKILIGLKDDYTITLGYYINDVFCGSFVRDLKNPGDGHRTIDTYNVEALYINGWTYVANTGFKMDDIMMGATANTGWMFDECDHNYVAGNTVAPTCETDGYTNFTCACGATKKDNIVPAIGHNIINVDAQASTCITQGWNAYSYCANCEDANTNKVLLPLVACAPGAPVREHVIAAECGVEGSYDEVVYCSVCHAELSREQKTIDALVHDNDVVVTGTPATCTASGLTDGAKCSKCGATTIEQTTINPLGHTIVVDPAVPATCKEDGKTAGEHCSVCDYKVVGTVISKDTVPHTYDNDEDADCNVCGAVRDVACKHDNTVEIPAVDATCTTAGSTAGSKCADCDEVLSAPTTVPATGHTEVVDAAVAATCTTAGKTEGKHCSVCSEVLVAQTVIAAKGHTETADHAVDPTCTTTGKTEGKHCSVCSEVIVAQEVVPALGHNYAAATCDAPKTCKVCGATEGEALANHTLACTVADGVATYKCATCTKSFSTTHTTYSTDGSSLTGFTFNDGKTNASYVGTTNGPVQKTDASGNLYYEFLRDAEYNSTVDGNKATGQATMWIPKYHDSANPGLKELSEANNSVLFVSFDIDFAMSSHLTLNLVYGKPSTGETWYESPLGKIMTAPLNIYTEKEGGTPSYVRVYGFGNEVGRYYYKDSDTFTAFGSTGWFNIQIGLVLSDDQITAHYYLDGQYVGSYSVENTLENNIITAVQLDGTSVDINSGYAFDNLVVGYANNATWNFDECAHQYGAEITTVLPTCLDKGYDAHTCELCGYVERFNFVDAVGHQATPATCYADSVCSVCADIVAPATGHTLTHTYANSTLTYGCTDCDAKFDILTEGIYYDGTDASVLNNTYVGGTSKYNNGANKLISNGEYFEAITDQDATVNTESQMQMWLPWTKDQTPNGKNFNLLTRENGSTGVLSFKLNVSLAHKSDTLSFKIVDNAWGGAGCIDSNVFQITTKSSGDTVLGYYIGGWNSDPASLGTTTILTLDQTGWTDWMDVKIAFTVNTAKDTVTAHYYINGKYVTSGEKNLTTTSDKLSCVYVNLNAWVKGTGYYIDDIAFGHTIDSHWTLDGKVHNVTPATCSDFASCSCGWNGAVAIASHNVGAPTYNKANQSVVYSCSNEGCDINCEFTGYWMDGAAANDFYFAANGGAKLDNSTGAYVMAWDGTDTSASNGGKVGSQLMAWIPHNGAETGLNGFTCENNTFGIISFRMKSSMSNSYNLSIGKERGYANWGTDGSWSLNYNILNIGAYSASGVTLTACLNGNTTLATIPAAGDGWSEWFDVELHISLTDNGKITIGYYINGELKATATKDQYVVPSTGKYLDIRCFYINGWTYSANTGFALDDVLFGYTDHYTLDGKLHKINTPDNCTENVTCSCGWVGAPANHNFGEATCISHCLDCGALNTSAAPHTELVVSTSGEYVTYSCGACGYYYALDAGMHDINDFVNSISDSSHSVSTENGYLEVTNTGVANGQHQFWVPGQTVSPELAGFTNANNATGFLSFSINAKDGHNTGIEFKVNANRNTANWGGPTNNGWSESSVGVFRLKPTTAGATTVGMTGYNGADLGSIAITGTDGWTGWIDVVIKMQLIDNNNISLDYYINGEFFKNITSSMVIWTHDISSLYINGRTNGGDAYMIDNFYFGFTLNGLQEVTEPFYNSVLAAEDVQSETLKTIVASKIKQCDQSNPGTDPSKDYFAEGGTPVYVLANGKDGSEVEALYISRSVAWLGTESAHFTEFRFAINGEAEGPAVTSITFNYKIDGTVEKNERYQFTDFDGTKFYSDAYVQVKTINKNADVIEQAGDNYPELAGSDLILDGEWHTFSYEFETPRYLIDFLLNLYHFQGEMLISDLVITYAE